MFWPYNNRFGTQQVSRQLERRLELLRKHLPELERKMASAIIELTHARGRWKDQLAHVQHTKVICEQMEAENEQHARRIQVKRNVFSKGNGPHNLNVETDFFFNCWW